jgi:hypothetical protein
MKRYRLTPPSVTIERALKSPSLLGARPGELSSWASWFACVKTVFWRTREPDWTDHNAYRASLYRFHIKENSTNSCD